MKKLLLALFFIPSAYAGQFSMDQCSVYFSPKGGTTDALVKYIGTAKSSVRVLAYNFTSKPIADALVAAHNRGVDVELVLDKSVPTERNSALPEMIAAHIPVWIDHAHAIAHNKTIIIDDEWVELGSFNFTDNAEMKNGENALICHSKDAYALYRANWDLHKSHSVVP